MGEEAVSARARDKRIDVVETTMVNKQNGSLLPLFKQRNGGQLAQHGCKCRQIKKHTRWRVNIQITNPHSLGTILSTP